MPFMNDWEHILAVMKAITFSEPINVVGSESSAITILLYAVISMSDPYGGLTEYAAQRPDIDTLLNFDVPSVSVIIASIAFRSP